jgi:heat-inducible transcriptional repressor
MLTAQPTGSADSSRDAADRGAPHADQPQRVIANAAQLLSSLSSFVGVITAPRSRACSTTSSSCASRSGACS